MTIAPGQYPAKILSHGPSTTREGRYALVCEITDGEHKGQRREWTCGLASESQKKVLCRALAAAGAEGVVRDDLGTLDAWLERNIESAEALTAPVVLVIENREYNGKTYDEVKYVNAAARTPAVATGGTRAARMAKLLGKAPTPAPTPFGSDPFGSDPF